MRVPDEILKSVCFIGYEMANGERRIAGTGFIFQRSLVGQGHVNCIVTARHVIEGIKRKGIEKVGLKLNSKSGRSLWHLLPMSDWYLEDSEDSPDVAVAINVPFAKTWDHLALPQKVILTHETRQLIDFGPGDDVFAVGFFSKHDDEERNWPIVRMGTVAAMDVERIRTRYGPRIGHLIETRSIGGLSGSPVFAKMQEMFLRDGQITTLTGTSFALLGLVHGHFDERDLERQVNEPTGVPQVLSINLGIAVVVPVADVTRVVDACLKSRTYGGSFSHLPPH